ncbi:MAG: hypothetical protein AB7K09_06765 [Planctomycetota bacterium]
MREITRTWRDLFLGFRIALDLRKMFLGLLTLLTTALALGVALLVLMWVRVDEQNQLSAAASTTADTRPDGVDKGVAQPWVDCRGQSLAAMLLAAIQDAGQPDSFGNDAVMRLGQVTRLTLADYGIGTFRHPATGVPRPRTGLSLFDVLLFAFVGLIWWAFCSRQLGAISRIAAVEVSRDVRIEMGKALAFARSRARPLFAAPVIIDMVFLLLCLGIALWAFIGWIPWLGPVICALTVPLVIFAGFLMAVLLIGGVLGSPMLVPALAVEGTDSFDALSRAYSFVYSRPWHYLLYNAIGLAYGAICVAFVFAFTLLMLALAALPARLVWGGPFERFLSFVMPADDMYRVMTFGAERLANASISDILEKDGPAGLVFVVLMLVVLIFVLGLALAYVVSYLTTMFTLIYYAMRTRVDGTDTTEIFYDEDDDLWMAPPPEVEQAVAATAAAAAVQTD